MRFIVTCILPAETFNALIMDGTMLNQLKSYMDSVKPQNVYFTVSHGQRTIYFVLNMPSEDKMMAVLEPLWLNWKADVDIRPAMTLADLQKGAADLAADLERRAQAGK